MNTVKYKTVIAVILIMLLATACSKKLMPPEIGSSSAGLESSDFTAPDSPQGAGNFGASGGSEDFVSGFSEDPILESGASANDGKVAGNSFII